MPNRNKWLSKAQPLGSPRIEIPYQRCFTPAEVECLRAGLWPQDMDDKWVVFLGNASLDMWRSWTGRCIFSLPAADSDDGVTIGPLLVNGDTAHYHRQSDAEDIKIVDYLINKLLTGGNAGASD